MRPSEDSGARGGPPRVRVAAPAALALCLLLCGEALRPAKAEEPADWTILVFMSADTDLELCGLADLAEMARVQHTEKVNVVVQCDRAEEDNEEKGYSGIELPIVGNFKDTRRLRMGTESAEPVGECGEANMGDPKTLADFLAWGVKKYPAKRTALVFWDHGSGWPGYGGDDSHDHDQLTLPEMEQALAQGLEAAGLPKLDLIGFDCCLMATLEVMRAVQPFGSVLVSSEEIEPGVGWHYEAWLGALMKDPGMAPDALGKRIADSYVAFFSAHENPNVQVKGKAVTLSVVDLGKVPPLLAAVDALGRKLGESIAKGGRAPWMAVARARHEAEEYGKSERGSSGHHDLWDLCRQLETTEAKAEATAVARAVEAAVLHHVRGKDKPQAHGVSIWFPQTEDVPPEVVERYIAAPPARGWLDLFQAYAEEAHRDQSAPGLSQPHASDADLTEGEHAQITADLTADDVAEVNFVLAERVDDESILIGMVPTTVEHLEEGADFDGKWLAMGDQHGQLLAPIVSFEPVDEEGLEFEVGISAVYVTPESGVEIAVTLYFDLTADDEGTMSGGLLYAFTDSPSGPREVELEEGGKVFPVYVKVTAEGEMEPVTVDEKESLVLTEEGLDLLEVDLPPAKYLVGFVVEDLAGNVAEALTEVEVD